MTEATQTGAAVAAPQTHTIASAAQALADRRQAEQTQQNQPNPSDAARILGQRAAQARQERLAEQQRQAQESSPEEGGNEQDDETPSEGETLNVETASTEQTDETNTDAKDEPAEGQTIDLGDGLTVTLDQVREGFMLKADHTRKTQGLAEERKAFEGIRTQKLAQLDQSLLAVQQLLPQPKDPIALIEELGVEEGTKEMYRQQALWNNLGKAMQDREAMQAEHLGKLRAETLKGLETKHGDKAESLFSKAVQYVASKTGTDAKNVEAMLSHPEAVELVNDAMAYRELKANEKNVTRTIAEKPKVVKPGAKVSSQAVHQSNVQNARAKLKTSGSLADAVAYLQAQRKPAG